MADKEKFQSMLQTATTTYTHDYYKHNFSPPFLITHKPKKAAELKPAPRKDVHTMNVWKDQCIPFSLLHKPRPITGTNPWEAMGYEYEKPSTLGREQAQKTRPRIVMTPAVSMDDIDDPRARTLLVDDMYTSDITKAQREAVKPYKKVQAPFAKNVANANPIVLPKLRPYMVSPEWRMETIHWDNNQRRSHCNATAEYWLNYKLEKCRSCEESAIIRAHRQNTRKYRK